MIGDDRPALETEEIDVTPEMVEAGEGEFGLFMEERDWPPEEVVTRIYLAMARLDPRRSP